ncbi:MAG: aminotransferase class V-fold PLP-dependent enzyme [Rhodospirillaceae bacterium]|jgi:alanine-glyoxylate transaminase / serine-glyoxylate transaminase / serine-pyruvate transaminase|nr:aminotransferase class V-fold PLP-dependent enzyme [Rhodospirillaceae bacterium]MBT5895884.1 aminotransferase class V-fold PLP-dependent enzyme [Rhodospirillaceae bacterium]MBT6429454.1 aminotransferase class V-fold PLP-dependent enzyme [Rhodospirillaceae bacterium]MBT7759641.1 aminotransferase class V-fold PLP-dependent enzyme [Rhodospirillaceae bacterium]
MAGNQPNTAGRHFLQIPGPTNVPDRILRAIDGATIDHRGPGFERLAHRVLDGIKPIFQTTGPVVIYPASGTGAWEAALVNTLSPGDRVLMAETGQFATLWRGLAQRLGLDVVFLPGDWRHGVRANYIAAALADDPAGQIKAVCCVHNETSTGVTSNIAAVRKAMDDCDHPALLMVDTISSLASIDYRHDEWGVDVTIGGSQKGLMLPPGLSFNAVGTKALAAAENATMIRSYWDWGPMIAANKGGAFPYTPATNLLYGLDEAVAMLQEEGLQNVFNRHARLAEATRRAVAAWGLETVARDDGEKSNSLTAVMLPDGHDADAFRATVLNRYNMSLGNGLGRLAGRAFRIGHLGDFNELMLAGTLSGVEMGLAVAGVPHHKGGVQAALEFLSSD